MTVMTKLRWYFLFVLTSTAQCLLPRSVSQNILMLNRQTASNDQRKEVEVFERVQYSNCSDPATDIFELSYMEVYPRAPKIGDFFEVAVSGRFKEDTGDLPWFTLGMAVNDVPVSPDGIRGEGPLCDLEVFQYMQFKNDRGTEWHRSCRPGIKEGYARIGMPILQIDQGAEAAKYSLRFDATTADERSIFCIEFTHHLER
ncbi:hypothetical protein GLAREA_06878 [Glarea lozoyensis ATCC 20868]|uniref:MD-2-related lipid-recognition domain-containing protein n=1 Tax=Glarea lozoyensis (strain ATCC 20868 / MF5171) TaxID=1116229 RepID=S3D7Z6_GLAL2|nr:uncharacterized protein GLAREA_06878 [Glarea lozoyensis ATCC 20868]EPE33865.1 hypothetical protein GLAREA_06878 [Glarea lozoyensis ATCC 20868]